MAFKLIDWLRHREGRTENEKSVTIRSLENVMFDHIFEICNST